jgi:RHS repeat-associated protein
VNADNELTEWTQGVQQITVSGQVEPGANSNNWFASTASAQGHSAPVSMQDGSFGIVGVPVNTGENVLTATVTDVSGNTATRYQNFTVGSAGSTTFNYDANGNMAGSATVPVAFVYQYDAENRLVTVTSNSVVVLQCWYDGSGHRIAKREIIDTQTNTFQYVWDGWNLIAVLGEDGKLKEFCTRGVGIAGDIGTLVAVTPYSGAGFPFATRYLHNNHRGDVIMARQGTNTVATLEYAPYGELRSYSGTYTPRFRFSSKEYDASAGFYHFPYRYYAPQWARWITRDPLENGELQEGANLYSYVRNVPVNHVDPDGRAQYKYKCPTLFMVPTPGGIAVGVGWYECVITGPSINWWKAACAAGPLKTCIATSIGGMNLGCSMGSYFVFKTACDLAAKCLSMVM